MLEPELDDTVINTHKCCCIMVESDGWETECPAEVAGSDVPFCSTCEDRHPDLKSRGITVTARIPRSRA